ncbi:MAG: 3-methyl-2-oxobutanoate hydroxymethyltransferase [Actinomycetes bacterium]|jgi:3-methyl-2-oxobutanoate hydroxymethyltransferase|nr:3-methyl-2-oxobutanoate hydroxymethyltransferase [Actinomycetes bacterium]
MFTARSFHEYKKADKRIVMCTAYDVWQGRLAAAAGIDAILVGDSMGTTTLGLDSTLGVSVDDIARATAAVVAGAGSEAFVVADMPFMSYQVSFEEGMRNAGRLVAQSGAAAVKVEGASPDTLTLVEGLTAAGIPVVGHLGLTPQSWRALGGYRVQAKELPDILDLLVATHLLMEAGICALVLECVPSEVARQITEIFDVATIGIGAGPFCDGEVQVLHDLLGLGGEFTPRHAQRLVNLEDIALQALETYVSGVRKNTFPDEAQTVHIKRELVEEASAAFVQHIFETFDDDDDDEEDDDYGDGNSPPTPPPFLGGFGAHRN